MIQISIRGRRELQRSEADVVERFVVDDEGFVGVFDELMDRQRCVVRLYDDVGHLRRGDDGECVHDPVWILFSDFGDEEGSHSGSGSTTEGVIELKSLQAIATFRLFAHDVENGVDQLGSFRIMPLGPIVTRTGLTENEIVWPEQLTERPRSHCIHGTRLQIDEDNTRDIFTACKSA